MPNRTRFPGRDVLSHPRLRQLAKLKTPQKVQDFLDSLPINFEKRGETCSSPLASLERGTVHCLEGALVACLALWMNGQPPLVMDLKTTDDDVDHVVTLFKLRSHWGAISKTNHGVLRFREPIYRDPRELAASFFHEYSLPDGRKTLRSYSAPFDLRRYRGDWIMTSRGTSSSSTGATSRGSGERARSKSVPANWSNGADDDRCVRGAGAHRARRLRDTILSSW
jgi:hypothetical protein